jgi:GT2 family glycosyltransferase
MVTWNGATRADAFLDSVQAALSGIDATILVYDNDSSDGTVELLRRRGVDVVAGGCNEGYVSHNYNARRAGNFDYLLVANDDVAVAEDSIRTMLDAAESVGPAVFGALIRKPSGKALRRGYHVTGFPSFVEWLFGRSLLRAPLRRLRPLAGRRLGRRMDSASHRLLESGPQTTHPVFCSRVSGCFMLISREVYDAVGLYDEQFFLYVESIDLLRRVTRAGFPVVFVPAAVVEHAGAASSRPGTDLGTMHNVGYSYYYRKHHGRAYAWAMHLCLFGDASLRWLANAVLGRQVGLRSYETRARIGRDVSYFGRAVIGRGDARTPRERYLGTTVRPPEAADRSVQLPAE